MESVRDNRENDNRNNIEENLSIEISTACNSNCTHCFAKAGLNKVSSLPLETVKTIVSEGYDLGYRNFHITGGEPLLYRDIFAVLDYVFETGYESVFFNTNGMLLSEETSAKLGRYGDRLHFSVSIQGDKILHDSVRGEGAFDRARKGILNGLKNNLKISVFTSVGMSLLPELANYVDWVFNEFKGIADLTLIQMIRVTDDALDLSDEVLPPDKFLSFVKIVSMLNLYGYKINVLENPLAQVVSKKIGLPFVYHSTPLHRPGRLIILADGSIGFTHSTRFSLDKYRPGILESVTNSDTYKRETLPDEVTCPDCEYFSLCRENTMVRPSEWYRDMSPEIPYCKRVLKEVESTG